MEIEIKDRTIALLVDSDNVSQKYFATLLDELSQYGRVTYRRLYGDFAKPKANGWEKAILDNSIELIYASSSYAKTVVTDKSTGKEQIYGKNTTDSKMIIDAMDILHEDKVDCFCLATSDSDFTNLAMRFRNDNIVVIGAGEEKTPVPFRNACDIFIRIDELLEAEKIEEEMKAAAKKNKNGKSQKKQGEKTVHAQTGGVRDAAAIIKTAKQIVENGSDAEGLMHFAAFMNELRRRVNDFNPRLYGATNNSPLQFFKNLKDAGGKNVFKLKKPNQVDKIGINK